MKHTSIKLDSPVEFINVQPLNPLISKCQIKVCYVGEEPNRNGSVITKAVATEMANSLPGCPIVGFYNETKEDFEEHNRIIDISDGKFEIKDTTKPYGFVDLNAKCWFQKFSDDGIEHEYLMTEGYLWTSQYPECKRVITKGNNQSMELDENRLDAMWAEDENGIPQFFIINEAVISKLCILGEENEPCFEGSQITKVQFSFEDGFKSQLYSMMKELTELLKKEGGTEVFNTYAVTIGDNTWNSLYEHFDNVYDNKYSIVGVCEEEGQLFSIVQNKEDSKYYRMNFSLTESDFVAEELVDITDSYTPAEEAQFALADVEAFEAEYAKKKKEDEDKSGKDDDSKSENNSEDDDSDDDEDPKKKKKKEYSMEDLNEIPEYKELQTKFAELETKYNSLVEEKANLEAQIAPLTEFKNKAERAEKEAMINSFYMLSDEDKKDVIDNIDTYTLDEIEAKLSITCVRNKVSFSDDSQDDKQKSTTFNLNNLDDDESTPAWVKAAMSVAKSMK